MTPFSSDLLQTKGLLEHKLTIDLLQCVRFVIDQGSEHAFKINLNVLNQSVRTLVDQPDLSLAL